MSGQETTGSARGWWGGVWTAGRRTGRGCLGGAAALLPSGFTATGSGAQRRRLHAVARPGSAAGDPSPATPIPWLTRGRGDLGARRQTTVGKERLLDHPGTPAKAAPGPGRGGRHGDTRVTSELPRTQGPPACRPRLEGSEEEGGSLRGGRAAGAGEQGAKRVRPEGRARFLTLSQGDSGSAGADGRSQSSSAGGSRCQEMGKKCQTKQKDAKTLG